MATRMQQDQDKAQWQAEGEQRTADLCKQLEAGVQTIQTDDEFRRYLQVGTQCHTCGRRRRK